MRDAAWSGYEEPVFVGGPTDGMVFFGAQVGHAPDREAQPEIGCSTCGGVWVFMAADPHAPVPIPFRYDPHAMVLSVPTRETDPLHPGNGVCAACMRWARDNWLATLMDAEYARRGTNEPIPVAWVEDVTRIPLPIAQIQAPG